MATFSWSDTFKIAFQSCLPCLRPNASDNASFQDADSNPHIGTSRIPRARSDELQGLLADVPDTDGEAESMSLHSNPGHTQQRKIKKKSRRRSKNNPQRKFMSLFGYHLFGRPSIQLADDSEDALYVRRGITVTPNTYSSSSTTTFDSDAAPLDTDAIDALSSPTAAAAVIEAAQASAEVEARRLWAKEERRRRRQQQKQMKRSLAKQAVGDEGEEFKGFQGSGGESPFLQKPSEYPGIPTKNVSESGSSSGSGSKPEHTTHGLVLLQRESGGDVVDLDGQIYARNASQGGSSRGSDSRSRTSASMSDRAPNSTDPASSTLTEGQSKLGKSRTKSSSSRTSKSRSSATSSQSPSLPSPLAATFAPESQHVVSPSTVERGQGFFDLEDVVLARNQESAYFPITGFGGATGGRKASSMGVFLAQRGDKPS
jgi:hypothetical protein